MIRMRAQAKRFSLTIHYGILNRWKIGNTIIEKNVREINRWNNKENRTKSSE